MDFLDFQIGIGKYKEIFLVFTPFHIYTLEDLKWDKL
jgi:hypothetical protein